MMPRNVLTFISILLLITLEFGYGQNSGRVYRRSAILNGNQVKTVFGNWGVIGQPRDKGPRGAWIFDTNGYIGDVSPLVGAEVTGTVVSTGRDTTFFWVIDCPVARPSLGVDASNNGTRQAFEPVSGYFNEAGGSPALSSDPKTWPPQWPDKMDDPFDPGWPGSWNGIFGKLPSADLETYFVMDDNADNEFSTPDENELNVQFLPDPFNPNRHGLGLEVKVRGLQWQQILAQDNIFWLYNIKNTGKALYPRTVFGMLVGTYVGVTGTDDSPQEYDDDWSFFDVYEDLTYTGDFGRGGIPDNSRNPFWQGAVGVVGYAFLESPGNPFDGIDNDNDADEGHNLASAPRFTAQDFNVLTVTNSPTPGVNQTNKIVTISLDEFDSRGNFKRTVHTFPANQDTFVVVSMGDTITLISGKTQLAEGNLIGVGANRRVNPNAFDGKDNDLDGLIDENYYLHFWQVRISTEGDTLFSLRNPVRHVDYINGLGLNDLLIDERRDDGVDNDGDWSRNPLTGEFLYDDEGNLIDDVGADGKPGTGDPGEYNGVPDKGEPNFDETDKSESDQIGLASFQYFTPANDIDLSDENDMWERMSPGFFQVPNSIQNNRPVSGEDGDFVYGSGYFPLLPGQTERLSLALIYAFESPLVSDEMIKKLETVRQIYDSDYRFPVAPQKPTLRAVAGNKQVTLYWDRAAEFSFDPVLREFDFEGYKIYRATDPSFNDVFTITNSSGTPVAYKAIAQFDLVNDYTGFFVPLPDIFQTLQGWSFNLGTNTGLQHSYVDQDVENGRTYYYAVVSYDRGNEEKGVIPSECTKKITQLNTGEIILDINTAMVTPTEAKAGYVAPKAEDELEHVFGDGFGTITYKVLDPTALTGHEYEVYFWDTSNDGIDNNKNWTLANDVGADGIPNTGDFGEGDGKPTPGEPNLDFKDNKELEAITTRYGVIDLHEYQEEFFPRDTFYVDLQRENLVEGSVMVRDAFGNVVDTSRYEIDLEAGRLRGKYPGSLQSQMHLITYKYHPVYFSEYIQGNPALDQSLGMYDSDNFDGLALNFDNIWRIELDTLKSGWDKEEIEYRFSLRFVQTPLYKPIFFPSNYEVRIYDRVVDSTTTLFGVAPKPRKFEVWNTTLNYKIEFWHLDNTAPPNVADSLPSPNEAIVFVEKDVNGDFNLVTLDLRILEKEGDPAYRYQFKNGDKLVLNVKFPFNRFDRFRFQTEFPRIDREKEKEQLDDIIVYPNPYIVAHEFEPPLPPNVTSGRGERRIYFSRIPEKSKIHIFTVRGEHVITLEDNNPLFNGTITWNLKTKENLDIAYGVYFYVVDSPAGKARGKLAIIK
ncbi:MAG: hypothetical protein Kow0042_02570 [Calditrichia bacterium]